MQSGSNGQVRLSFHSLGLESFPRLHSPVLILALSTPPGFLLATKSLAPSPFPFLALTSRNSPTALLSTVFRRNGASLLRGVPEVLRPLQAWYLQPPALFLANEVAAMLPRAVSRAVASDIGAAWERAVLMPVSLCPSLPSRRFRVIAGTNRRLAETGPRRGRWSYLTCIEFRSSGEVSVCHVVGALCCHVSRYCLAYLCRSAVQRSALGVSAEVGSSSSHPALSTPFPFFLSLRVVSYISPPFLRTAPYHAMAPLLTLSPLTAAILALSTSTLILLIRHLYPRNLPPGPRASLWGWGNHRHLIPAQRPWLRLAQLEQEADWPGGSRGFFTVWTGPNPTIVLSSARVAADLLERRSSKYSSRPRSVVVGELMTGGDAILFLPYGKKWLNQRRLYHAALAGKAAETYVPIQELEAKRLAHDVRVATLSLFCVANCS